MKKKMLMLTIAGMVGCASILGAGAAQAAPTHEITVGNITTCSNTAFWNWLTSLKPVKPSVPQVQPDQQTQPNTDSSITENSTAVSEFAQQVADLVNQERAKEGLSPLTLDVQLSEVAMLKAKDMYENNYFSHQSPTYGSPFDMMRANGISYQTAGENIAKGQQSPEEVMNAWMNSDGHRKNIMSNSFTKIGVAYYNGVWVQQFIG